MPSVRKALKGAVLAVHRGAARFGVHVLPVHYYSPVPNVRELERTRELWAGKSELPGIHVDLDAQIGELRRVCLPFESEYRGNRFYKEAVAEHFGPGYGYVEAQALHGFVRHLQPRRIIEVGSGVSTYCMLKAAAMNTAAGGREAAITAIEPYPSASLQALAGVQLLPQPVQTVPIELFQELGESDLLFVDSSHTVRTGGDVNRLVLEVLPRLRPGVVVHFHDIFLPYDYQRDLFGTLFHWSETSLLRAFLIGNEHARIIACLSHLHYERRDALRGVFPEYDPQPDDGGLAAAATGHFPSSTYLRMV